MAKITLKGDIKLTVRTPAEEAKVQLSKTLIHVCHYNQLDKAKALIAKGADPSYRNRGGETPIYAAAGSGGLEVFEYLASLGCACDVKTCGNQTLLHNAVATGDVTVRLSVQICLLILSLDCKGSGNESAPNVGRAGV
jgi:ankyrin repeat protein